MIIEVSEATPKDLESISQIYATSFLPVAPKFFPSGLTHEHLTWRKTRLASYEARMRYERDQGTRSQPPLDESHLIKATIKETGENIGLCYFTIEPKIKDGMEGEHQKQRRDEREKSLPPISRIPSGTDEEKWKRFIQVIGQAKEKYVGNRAFVCEYYSSKMEGFSVPDKLCVSVIFDSSNRNRLLLTLLPSFCP